ncbi:MAG: hypothetical protein FJY56_08055 [Betaproteobacteria bacterium]|nr:hypothetical protein [Betaproteobacteria bacterium]
MANVVRIQQFHTDVNDFDAAWPAWQVHLPAQTCRSRRSRCPRSRRWGNGTPDFAQHPQVIDGASDLLSELLGGDRGRHARSAVGRMSLPRGIAVEMNGEFELE